MSNLWLLAAPLLHAFGVSTTIAQEGRSGSEVREVAGKVSIPDERHTADGSCRLVGDYEIISSFQDTVRGDFDVGGHTLRIDTGGGNVTTLTGAISGDGVVEWIGGGTGDWQTTASFIAGARPNSFRGTWALRRGTLALCKPPGVDAMAGSIVLGGGSNQVVLRLDADHQIADSASLHSTGEHPVRIRTAGHDETLGTLRLEADAVIDLGDGDSVWSFADSSRVEWDLTKTLTIEGWTKGRDRIAFRDAGLSSSQLARVGFWHPNGADGSYRARLDEGGALVPAERVEPIDPPFDISAAAREARERLHAVRGLELLTGRGSRLRDGARIAFFGDSITWSGGYIEVLRKALAESDRTRELEVALLNHGINGGGVREVRDGDDEPTHRGDVPPRPFASTLAADRVDVAVVYIGVNDVWWRETDPAVFESALRDLVRQAAAHGATPVLATLSVLHERPDGTNPRDLECDRFAELTRKVARDTGSVLVDVRGAFIAYLQNHNARLRVDGSLESVESGILTTDGVHPSRRGERLTAELIAAGIHEALGLRPREASR